MSDEGVDASPKSRNETNDKHGHGSNANHGPAMVFERIFAAVHLFAFLCMHIAYCINIYDMCVCVNEYCRIK